MPVPCKYLAVETTGTRGPWVLRAQATSWLILHPRESVPMRTQCPRPCTLDSCSAPTAHAQCPQPTLSTHGSAHDPGNRLQVSERRLVFRGEVTVRGAKLARNEPGRQEARTPLCGSHTPSRRHRREEAGASALGTSTQGAPGRCNGPPSPQAGPASHPGRDQEECDVSDPFRSMAISPPSPDRC